MLFVTLKEGRKGRKTNILMARDGKQEGRKKKKEERRRRRRKAKEMERRII